MKSINNESDELRNTPQLVQRMFQERQTESEMFFSLAMGICISCTY